MQFRRMKMKNWYAFKGDQELVFPDDQFVNIMVIFGENMFGKTSLQNAIRWCLYGESLTRQGTEVQPKDIMNELASQNGETEFGVVLEFTVGDVKYELTRNCKLELGQSPKTKLILIKDGRAIAGGSISSEIEAIAPKQISQFMLFDGETLQEFENLVTSEGSPKARDIKDAIEKALGIPVFKRAEVELQNLQKTLNKERSRDVAAKKSFENLNNQINAYEAELESFRKEERQLEEQLKDNKDQLIVLENKVSERAKDQGLSTKRESLIAEANNNAKLIKESREELKIETSDCWKFVLAQTINPKKRHLNEKINSLTNRITQITTANAKIFALQKSLGSDKCDQCGHTLTEIEKNHIQSQIDSLMDTVIDVSAIQEQLRDCEIQLQSVSLIENSQSPLKIMKKLTQEILDKTKRNYKIQNEKYELDNKLANFDTGQAQSDQKQIKLRSEEIGKLEEKIQQKEKSIKDTDLKIKELKNRPEWKQATKGSRSSDLADRSEGILQVFQSAMELYRNEMREKIQKRASETFKMLTTEPDFERLELNDAYGLHLISDGKKVARSAGGEQIVALSLIESLNYLGRIKGPMFMDTPAGRLDETHRENIMNYLPKVVTQLVVLAHSGELKEDNIYFDQSKIGKKYRINRHGTFHSELEAI